MSIRFPASYGGLACRALLFHVDGPRPTAPLNFQMADLHRWCAVGKAAADWGPDCSSCSGESRRGCQRRTFSTIETLLSSSTLAHLASNRPSPACLPAIQSSRLYISYSGPRAAQQVRHIERPPSQDPGLSFYWMQAPTSLNPTAQPHSSGVGFVGASACIPRHPKIPRHIQMDCSHGILDIVWPFPGLLGRPRVAGVEHSIEGC